MTLLVPFDRPVVTGRLVRRYQRFFVDVLLDDAPDGTAVAHTAHTANTGAMTGLVDAGSPVLLTLHDDNPKRAYPYELEAVRVDDGSWVSVNTGAANAFAANAVARDLVDELKGYGARVRREVSPSPRSKSRFDLCLGDDCYVEVKSVTLKRGDRALFPDAVTARGRKHLDALARLASKGRRAAMLYVNKRPGSSTFAPAAAIDPDYARALRRAASAGVEVYCISCAVDARGLSYAGRLPVELA